VVATIILWKLNGSYSYGSKNSCSKQAMKQKRRYAGAGDAGDAGDAGSSVIWLYGTSDGSKNMILFMMIAVVAIAVVCGAGSNLGHVAAARSSQSICNILGAAVGRKSCGSKSNHSCDHGTWWCTIEISNSLGY
jgi:hypothetical protein